MDIIRRRHLKNGRLKKGDRREYIEREYRIFTEEEARDRDIQYVNWTKVGKGKWGLTDDGWVGECIDRRQYKEKDNVVFSFGQYWYTPSNKYGKCEYAPHKESESYAMTSPKKPWEVKKGRREYKNFVSVYVAQMLEGKVDYTTLGKVFGESKNYEIKARMLLKKEYVKEMIDKELKAVFEEKGVNEGSVIDMINDAHKIAREKNDPSNMLRAAENFVKILKMDAKNEQKDSFDTELSSLERIGNAMELNPAQEILSEPVLEIKGGSED